MPRPLSEGERITYVEYEGHLCLASVSELLTGELADGSEVDFVLDDLEAPVMYLSEEGTLWIRGHHSARSHAGRALLAAYALARSRVA